MQPTPSQDIEDKGSHHNHGIITQSNTKLDYDTIYTTRRRSPSSSDGTTQRLDYLQMFYLFFLVSLLTNVCALI